MIWLLVAFCWAISFLFAGIEAGLLALDPVRMRHRADSGDRGARRLQKMVKQPERLLITVLIATNAADIIALIILTHELVLRLGWLGYLTAVAIGLPVYLFLLGVLPKSLGVAAGDHATFLRNAADVQEGGVAFFLSCVKLTPPGVLARNHHNLVVHASALPHGRGFSPVAKN